MTSERVAEPFSAFRVGVVIGRNRTRRTYRTHLSGMSGGMEIMRIKNFKDWDIYEENQNGAGY